MNHPANAPLPQHRHLARGDFLRLSRGPRWRVQTESGSLWVTVDGEPEDHQIDAGQSRQFDGHAPIMIGTLGGDAVFSATSSPRDDQDGPTWRPALPWRLSAAGWATR